VTGCIV